jgi:hypothetical protein
MLIWAILLKNNLSIPVSQHVTHLSNTNTFLQSIEVIKVFQVTNTITGVSIAIPIVTNYTQKCML